MKTGSYLDLDGQSVKLKLLMPELEQMLENFPNVEITVEGTRLIFTADTEDPNQEKFF